LASENGTGFWREYRIGIVVTAVLALITIAVFFLGAGRGPFVPDTYPLHVNLDEAGGIRIGSMVQVAGVAAGEVTNIEIIPAGQARSPGDGERGDETELRDIRLEIHIDETFRPHVTPSSRARLANLGLGAERYLEISAGDAREEPIGPGGTVRTVASVDWDLVLAKLSRALNEANEILYLTGEVKTKAMETRSGTIGLAIQPDSPLYPALQGLIEESAALLDLIESGEGVVGQFGRDRRLKDNLEGLNENLDALQRAMEGEEEALGHWVEPTELRAALGVLGGEIDALQARLESGHGSGGRFLHDDELFVQIRALRERIVQLMAAFRADPLGFVDIDVF